MKPSLLICSALLIGVSAHAEPIKFSRDVLPILSDNCFACHGPDAKARKADLRLDQKESALANGIVVPGKSTESELFKRFTTKDLDELMPPAKSIHKITRAQIATIKKWINEGAVWGQALGLQGSGAARASGSEPTFQGGKG